MSSNQEILDQVYKQEETDNFIYSIREELMDRVMKECYDIYIKKQTIRFVVQCAYDALVKFISISCYYHYPVPNIKTSSWTSDVPIEPSPKDTWAIGAVPVRPFDVGEGNSEDRARDKTDNLEERSFSCYCPKNLRCMCTHREEEVFDILNREYQESKDQLSASSMSHEHPINVTLESASKKSFTMTKQSVVDFDQSARRANRSDTLTTTVTKESSPGTQSDSVSDVKRRKKKKDKVQVKDVKQEVPDPVVRGSKLSLVKLPPLRINTKVQSKPDDKKKKKF
ncbi:uncharacterized protein LOC115886628 [Sitophilus oryzae]|uniref:Uncharacterized protein LOC115886628 n=1 Tax=Sitophilus oryzae TaxID=7048 RepID=A0A6J2YF21_SITOR|nr:uncharacterized protein LOC115886628 [Sitophilus oryzae]